MIEHWPGEEECHVGVNMELREQCLDGGQPSGVVVLGHVGGQECSELDQGVVTLIKQLPDKFQMIGLRSGN